jgi:hypothetical protein
MNFKHFNNFYQMGQSSYCYICYSERHGNKLSSSLFIKKDGSCFALPVGFGKNITITKKCREKKWASLVPIQPYVSMVFFMHTNSFSLKKILFLFSYPCSCFSNQYLSKIFNKFIPNKEKLEWCIMLPKYWIQ